MQGSKEMEWGDLKLRFDDIDMEETFKIYCLYDEQGGKDAGYDHVTVTIGSCKTEDEEGMRQSMGADSGLSEEIK
ncbi:unnamed protein product [Sphagnum balticum]